ESASRARPSRAGRGPCRRRVPTPRVELLASGLDHGLGGADCLVAVVVGRARRRSALAMDREVPDARMLAAHRALRIAPKLDLAKAHAESVVGQEPTDLLLADDTTHLVRLNRTHHSE